MRPVTIGAVAALVLAGACAKLDCEQRTATATGDLGQDVVGSWDGFGTDSRVIFTFSSDGGFTIVEAPNMYAPGGNHSRGSYQVTDGGMDLGAYGRYTAEVGADGLTLTDDAGYRRTHAALTCRGTNFE